MKKALSLIALRFRRTWLVMLSISLIATTLGWLRYSYDVLDAQDDETSAFDNGVKKFTNKSWFPWGKTHRSDDIIIVAIDEKTLSQGKQNKQWQKDYGTWPYDRVIYAKTFEYLHSLGTKAIVFDSILDEPRAEPSGDIALGDTVREQGIPLYLGFNVSPFGAALPPVEATNQPVRAAQPKQDAGLGAEEDAGTGEEEVSDDVFGDQDAGSTTDEQLATLDAGLHHLAELYAFPVEVDGGISLQGIGDEDVELEDGGLLTRSLKPVPTIAPVLDAVAGYGLVLQEGDGDGKLRHTRFAYSDGVNTYVTLPLALYADVVKADKIVITPGQLTVGSKVVRVDKDGSAWINYGGTLADRFRTIPLIDVLRYKDRPALQAEARALFKDKYVFVAGFALGTGDSKATPLEAQVPGVVKQVATFENLLHDNFITDAPWWVSLIFAFFVAFGSAALVMLIRNSFFDIAWPVMLWLGFFLVTGSFLTLTNIHILSALAGFSGTLASVFATTWERLFADEERERLKEIFKPYMEEDLVEMLAEQRELPKLDGENREITVYFSDIKGFSTFSEAFSAEPKGLMRLLNRYLSAVTPVIRDEGACIDKYIGDAVVALFGTPVAHDDHALRACRAALEVQKVVARLREEFRKEGLPDVYTRIGLNTDTLLVGNIGSDQLLDYTAIGDGMNLGSRLEGVNKVYGTLILMGENTYAQVKRDVFCREVDRVRVAGKHHATTIYELAGLKGDETKDKLAVFGRYELALKLYREQKFDEAHSVFEECLAVDPTDGPSLTMRARCEQYLVEPPPEGWDGVVDLEK